ncbi:MAG: type I methionyl aminopeptidase [Spirochaetota bacterium]
MRKLTRNDLCWCGSGKKYKKCHMESDLLSGAPSGRKIKLPRGVNVKTAVEIEGLKKSGILTRDILDMVGSRIGEGVSTEEINTWVHEHTIKNGAIPAPLNYNGFPKSVCTSINDVICHGIPDKSEILKNGDIINVDVTCILDGYFADASRMYIIGKADKTAQKLVSVTKECLYLAIDQVKPYNDFGVIGQVIEKHALENGFSVVRDYGGHGIGKKFHEEPHVHHYDVGFRGIPMVPGMVFTIEPMINSGRYESKLLGDNWTAVTADGSLSAQWEHTLCVTEKGCEIITE